MDLNEVLFGLTCIGPEGFPLTRMQLLEVLSQFGFKSSKQCKAVLQMLQLTGHIEYVLDARSRGLYRLAKPQLRPRPDRTYLFVGARSPGTLKFLHAKTEPGITWEIDNGILLKQPDIAIIEEDALNKIDGNVLSALGADNPQEMKTWTLPPGDLPSWEAMALNQPQPITEHPTLKFKDEGCALFNPDTLESRPVIELAYVFDQTGPLFLVRRSTATNQEDIVIIKTKEGKFLEHILPPGLDHQRWARLMILASYGIETIKQVDGDFLETKIMAQLPIGLCRALVDITGKLPRHEGGVVQFHGVREEIAKQIIDNCIYSFVSTNSAKV